MTKVEKNFLARVALAEKIRGMSAYELTLLSAMFSVVSDKDEQGIDTASINESLSTILDHLVGPLHS